jgi:hypothetical protein
LGLRLIPALVTRESDGDREGVGRREFYRAANALLYISLRPSAV